MLTLAHLITGEDRRGHYISCRLRFMGLSGVHSKLHQCTNQRGHRPPSPQHCVYNVAHSSIFLTFLSAIA